MRRLTIILLLCAGSALSFAQSTDFNNVFRACSLAQSAMSDGKGSKTEIREAEELLTKAEWNPLILQNEDIKGEASLDNHLVFKPEFLSDLAQGRKVFENAEKYAKEEITFQRGGDVQLVTKCVKARKKVSYSLRSFGGCMNVAAVAETNGLVNLTVDVIDEDDNIIESRKESSDEFKGASSRLIKGIKVPEGNMRIIISIENKSKRNKSVAIIVE